MDWGIIELLPACSEKDFPDLKQWFGEGSIGASDYFETLARIHTESNPPSTRCEQEIAKLMLHAEDINVSGEAWRYLVQNRELWGPGTGLKITEFEASARGKEVRGY